MYRVLVPIDRNGERAAAQADAVKRLPDAAGSVHVTLLHVFDDAEELAETDLTETESGKLFIDELAEDDVTVETERRTGKPAEVILQVANEIAADVIILGGRKRSPLGSLLFGSVSQSVLLDAARPVTITGTQTKPEPSHRCQSCGETYYASPEETITTCRHCGGVQVEPTRKVTEEA